MLTIDSAITVFTDSFVCTRSIARPAEVMRQGPFQIVRDVARTGDVRKEEIVFSSSVPDAEIKDFVAHHDAVTGYSFDVYAPVEAETETIRRIKALGYRYLKSEPLMVRSTEGVPATNGLVDVRLVKTPDEAERLAKAAGQRQVRTSDLEGDIRPIRAYFVEDKGAIVGWGRTVFVNPDGAYVGGMYTAPSHRRKGQATQLMRRMLADNRAAGADYSVLLASRVGEQLYLSVGYERIGTLLMFSPTARG